MIEIVKIVLHDGRRSSRSAFRSFARSRADSSADRSFRRRTSPDVTARLERIEQAVEAVAIEVERIAEAQRFSAKLMAEQAKARSVCRAPTHRRRKRRDMPSVLIVDDEPNIRRMVGALLGAEGYEVRDAHDGASGTRARARRPSPTSCCSIS